MKYVASLPQTTTSNTMNENSEVESGEGADLHSNMSNSNSDVESDSTKSLSSQSSSTLNNSTATHHAPVLLIQATREPVSREVSEFFENVMRDPSNGYHEELPTTWEDAKEHVQKRILQRKFQFKASPCEYLGT